MISSLTLTNPIAMTCAAIGAIYYGWNALSEDERNEALAKLSHGLEVGTEMVRSMIDFVIRETGDLLSSEQMAELKKFVSDGAKAFGRTLSDVTKKVTDIIADAYSTVATAAGEAGTKTKEAAEEMTKAAGEAFDKTKQAAEEAVSKVSGATAEAVDAVKDKFERKDSAGK